MKSSEVSIRTRSTPASLSFKGQATKHTTVKWSIETRQVGGLDITLATPRKVSFDSHHECRNINRSRNDGPTPPVCSLQSAFCTHRLE